MYTIEVSYQTGNSFYTEDVVEDIGLCWSDKQLAINALKALKEHYELYAEKESWGRFRSNEEIFREVVTKAWYSPQKNHDSSYWLYNSCVVSTDDGSLRPIPTYMWCGYFEKLLSAKIVLTIGDSDECEVNF